MPKRAPGMTVNAPARMADSAAGHDWGRAGLDVPARVAGWFVTPVRAGLWLSEVPAGVPPEVAALAAEPETLSVIIAAPGPGQRTDELVGVLLPLLEGQVQEVRLVLSRAADRYRAAAAGSGLNLVTADDAVVIPPHGYALVRPASPGGPLPQRPPYLAPSQRKA